MLGGELDWTGLFGLVQIFGYTDPETLIIRVQLIHSEMNKHRSENMKRKQEAFEQESNKHGR